MKRIFYFIFATTLFCIACSQKEFGVTKVIFKFDGLTEEFGHSYNLIREIKDSISYTNLIRSINNSESSFLDCPPHRKMAWRIEIYYVSEFGNERLFYNIICTTKNKIGLWNSLSTECYKNDFLIKNIIEMAKVEEIRNFKGKMTQKDYDKLFEVESSE